MKWGTIFGMALAVGYVWVFITVTQAVSEIYGKSSWEMVAAVFVMGPVLFASFFSHPTVKEFIDIGNGGDRERDT